MTDDDNDTLIPNVIPSKRGPGRPAKVHLYPREEEPKPERKPAGDELFNGITAGTAGNCPDGCSEKGCVITGENLCGHPHKSGLQPKHMMQKDVMARFERAKDYLKHQAIDKKRKEA